MNRLVHMFVGGPCRQLVDTGVGVRGLASWTQFGGEHHVNVSISMLRLLVYSDCSLLLVVSRHIV